MSIEIMKTIWNNTSLGMGGVEKAILLKLADHANIDGEQIFPSYKCISDKTGFCLRTVKSQIKKLISRNILLLVKQGSHHTHKANEYRINVEILTENQEIKSVHKSVDKPVHEYRASAVDALGDGAGYALGASAGDAPQTSLTSTINKHHHVKGPQDDSFREEVFGKFIEIGVQEQSIRKWEKIFGLEVINYELKSMFEYYQNKELKNPGACIRKILNERLKKMKSSC